MHLPEPPRGRTIVIGAGKASARMALAVEQHWPTPPGGLVVTRYGHGAPCQSIEIVEAAHPVPDDASHAAAERMLRLVQGLTADDLVICLISGGGSSLLSLPAPGLSLGEKRRVNAALLKSGANITEMNCVRTHLSAIKGGRLALACYPARLVTLVLSDVPGDDPATVASGPTVACATTAADARDILRRYSIATSSEIDAVLSDATHAAPLASHPRLGLNRTTIVASAQLALEAAAAAARDAGYQAWILGDSMEGEARDAASVHAAIARQVAVHNQPFPKPCVLLSGGETTVTVRGNGRGGRNTEFLLALALALNGLPGVHALACDTDGIDGTENNAGCYLSPDTLRRAHAAGVKATTQLANNDCYGFFEAVGGLLVTGPTGTNVNDFRAILIQ